MSLSAKIFLGLGLGIATGIFLGEITAPLKAVGSAYVQLLQMAVLPYRHYSDVRDRQIEIRRGCPAFVTRGQSATGDLGIDLRSLVYLPTQLSQLAIRVVL